MWGDSALTLRDTRAEIARALEGGAEDARAKAALSTLAVGRYVLLRAGPLEQWAYVGPQRHHLLIPMTYCSCHDFLIRTVAQKFPSREAPAGRPPAFCKHLLGLEIARGRGKFAALNVTEEELRSVIREILKYGYSQTLRRKL